MIHLSEGKTPDTTAVETRIVGGNLGTGKSDEKKHTVGKMFVLDTLYISVSVCHVILTSSREYFLLDD
jgi:hypothetical protein